MNRIAKVIIVIAFYLGFTSTSLALEQTFYILRTHAPAVFTSLNNNYKKINILITQAFHIDQDGVVTGSVDQSVLNFANEHDMKLMILVTNSSFDPDRVHQFLSNSSKEDQAIQTILTTAKQYHFYGVQFDFEGISFKDKNALTSFYLKAAKVLHENNFHVSFAIIPLVPDTKPTSFLKRKYENWSGAYDLRLLGVACDFITIMSYDQHTDGTTPGATASMRWVEASINYALRFIPASKLSLGIPVYSGYWATGNRSGKSSDRITTHLTDVSYQTANMILTKNNAKLRWDETDKVNYAIYQRHWLNEYLFIENQRSFKAKLALVKKYHLRGISVFNLGNEDPAIWNLLK